MSGHKGFGTDLWKQMQKVRIDRDGTYRAPVKANGRDGIVIGDPPLDPLGIRRSAPTPRLLHRLKLRLARV